jgi:dihydrofolate synthase/folylpolyglutamate synthase
LTYQQTIDFLYEQLPVYQKIGIKAYKKDLTNIKLLCEALDHPQLKFKSIHIAGTNGKGSTSHMLASICQAAGLKTGLYTSPHLVDFRERIKVNGELMNKNSVIQFVKKIKSLIFEIEPSFFEITVAMAFYYFEKQKIDIAIIETGLGGRLDSTNIILPILSVITNISLEHQAILGDTLPLIAAEKAGIIKSNIPVVIGQYQNETAPVFEQVAKKQNAALFYSQNMFHVNKVEHKLNYIKYTISDSYNNTNREYNCELKGIYQAENITTVLSCVAVLKQHKLVSISERALKSGLQYTVSNTHFLGRWQTLQEKPKIIVDCAHNAAGIASIFNFPIQESYQQLHIIFGCVADKDLSEIVRLLPKNAKYYITQPTNDRARHFNDTAIAFQNEGLHIVGQDQNPTNMLNFAKKNAAPQDLILVIGSVFLVADILSLYKK